MIADKLSLPEEVALIRMTTPDSSEENADS